MKRFLLKCFRVVTFFGFNPLALLSLRYLPRYIRDLVKWKKQGGQTDRYAVRLTNYNEPAGNAESQYFHQDLIVAQKVYEDKPTKHLDFGSRIDGFVAHVASFREIDVMDVRALETGVHQNIKFCQSDIMNPQNLEKYDSVSCLHTIEHVGLGRYGDNLKVDGHWVALKNLISLVSKGGRFYISFPVEVKDTVYFNAHRTFSVATLPENDLVKSELRLIQFDIVDSKNKLHFNQKYKDWLELASGCGIYTFEKL
jgi:hypothetical protein